MYRIYICRYDKIYGTERVTRLWSTHPQIAGDFCKAAGYSEGSKHLRTGMGFREQGRRDTEEHMSKNQAGNSKIMR